VHVPHQQDAVAAAPIITPNNANVYFEVGYALALAKPTTLLARKGTSLPFDVAGFRVLFMKTPSDYEDTIGGKSRVRCTATAA
jgi:hypothetical protein